MRRALDVVMTEGGVDRMSGKAAMWPTGNCHYFRDSNCEALGV